MNDTKKLEWLNSLLTNLQLLVSVNTDRRIILELIDIALKIIDEDTIFTEREQELFHFFFEQHDERLK